MSRDRDTIHHEAEDEAYESSRSREAKPQTGDESADVPDDVKEREAEEYDEDTDETTESEEEEGQPERWNLSEMDRRELPRFGRTKPVLSHEPEPGVADRVRPQGTLTQITNPAVTTQSVSLTQESDEQVRVVCPKGRLETQRLDRVRTIDIDIEHAVDTVSRSIQTGSELLELEDPFYTWTGAAPYHTGTPSVVIHVAPDSERGDSLAFLERRLRDEYTQRRGGEPAAKRVRMVADKPKLPDISGTIATFDLTTEGWELDTKSGSVRVERDGRDALSFVEAIINTSFSGDLGYLILNVPADWADPIVRSNVFARIHSRLSPDRSEAPSDTLPTEQDEGTPIVTRCEPESSFDLREAARYWFGQALETTDESSDEIANSVEGYEAQYKRTLRQADWVSTVITEQDESESDEHYLLKAAVATGLVRRLYEASSADELESFLFNEILDESKVETEDSTGGRRVDCRADWDDALESFVPLPESLESPQSVFFEVETGRGEAEANFRKIWHTIDRLSAESDKDEPLICVVVPPWLLAKTSVQANHIRRLVSIWNSRVESDESTGPVAVLTIPAFDAEGNLELRKATDFIKEVYADA